jgi:hypothetical protein
MPLIVSIAVLLLAAVAFIWVNAVACAKGRLVTVLNWLAGLCVGMGLIEALDLLRSFATAGGPR